MLQSADIESINDSAIRLIGSDWMLVSAGTVSEYNTMTAAWGSLGFLWKMPVATIFIRPQRHTYGFVEKADYFSICFFEEKYREMLNYCGRVSGRDVNKAKETGLEAVDHENKAVYFSQAKLVMICRKLYYQDLQPEHFLDKGINKLYPQQDYHRMYIGEIVKTLITR
jgi:flavin reductase (DIM6/NTAB) family NADH-FMN oxidoreductase RutF